MTVKQFFKSTSFKCLAALLCVLLVSGVFLTIAYGFMRVTEGERLQRAIKKMYDASLTVTVYGAEDREITADDEDPKGLLESPVTYGNAEIQQAYKIAFAERDDINYLVSSMGKDGYGGGTVTCWVAVQVDDAGVTGIGNVSVASNAGQSFIGKITDDFLGSFSEGFSGSDTYYSPADGYLSAGATKSSTAICNAVNGAIAYVDAEFFGNATEDKFEGFAYTEYIDTVNPATDYTVNGNSVTYRVVTLGYEKPGAFIVDITVGEGGVITAYSIDTNGSTADRYVQKMPTDILDGSRFTGQGLSFFTTALGTDLSYPTVEVPDLSTGATMSNYLCYYAGAFATANYEKCLGAQGGN